MKIMTTKMMISCLIFCGVGVVVFCLGVLVGRPKPSTEEQISKCQNVYMDYLTSKGYKPEFIDYRHIRFEQDKLTYVLIMETLDSFCLAYYIDPETTNKVGRPKAISFANWANSQRCPKFFVRDDNTICITISTFLRRPKDIELVFDDMITPLYLAVLDSYVKLNE